jgi:pimeloyl-ACP methyl ester carboxylesterase
MSLAGLHIVRHHVDAPGPPVVIVHGAPDRSKNFAHVVHMLSDMPVTVYDRRGYGRSIPAAVAEDGEILGGFEVHANDLIELLDGRPSVVVGQSAGGAVAMLAATKAPELFAALGVWEPPMVPWDWWAGAEATTHMRAMMGDAGASAMVERFNRQMIGDERWDGLREVTRAMLLAEGPAFHADLACQFEQYLDLSHLKVPVLVGWANDVGQDMPDHLRGASRRLAEHCDAETFMVEGANHFAHTGRPDVWAELVRRTVALANRSPL